MSAVLAEVADILNNHQELRCRPTVEQGPRGAITFTIEVRPDDQPDGAAPFETAALLHEMQFLVGLAQVRAFATQYHINSAALEALLPHAIPTDKETQ